MTDAELEELDVVTLAEVMLEADQGGYSPFAWHGIVRPLISTIRSLREENAARDRVVEAARVWKDAKSALIWSKPRDACESAKLGDDYEKADRALSAALAALEEQS